MNGRAGLSGKPVRFGGDVMADSPVLYPAAVKQQSRTSATLPCNFTNDVVVGDITVAMIEYSSIT